MVEVEEEMERDGCTLYLTPLSYILKIVNMVNFVVCGFYAIKNGEGS